MRFEGPGWPLAREGQGAVAYWHATHRACACWRAEIRLCAHSAVRDSFVWYACGRVVRHAVGQWLVSSDSLAGNLLGFIGTMRQGGVGYRTLF